MLLKIHVAVKNGTAFSEHVAVKNTIMFSFFGQHPFFLKD